MWGERKPTKSIDSNFSRRLHKIKAQKRSFSYTDDDTTSLRYAFCCSGFRLAIVFTNGIRQDQFRLTWPIHIIANNQYFQVAYYRGRRGRKKLEAQRRLPR